MILQKLNTKHFRLKLFPYRWIWKNNKKNEATDSCLLVRLEKKRLKSYI